ncbi:GNAT family N-acetyltransferase [Pseudonocardia sp. GCM10023141]|uniref:GNAT family N-acetyltransferase n=1 Tax=Pseudonocardia sp. GCM10023141 TaxID=3252653 RepID=UPI00361F1230
MTLLLETTRVTLRRFRPTDAVAFAAYRSRPEVARYQSWTAPVSLPAAVTTVARFVDADPEEPGWFQYAIALRSTDELVGDIGIDLHENGMQAQLGFTLAPAFQGRGLATEAVGGLLDVLFDERGLHRVSAECDARNHPSARLLRRLGFREEGLLRSNTWIKGEWTDDLLFGLLAADRREFAGS